MAANFNELILDRVRYVTAHDLETKEKLFMLTQIEEPSLNCTAEGEDVTDAVGALITTRQSSLVQTPCSLLSLLPTSMALSLKKLLLIRRFPLILMSLSTFLLKLPK